MKIAIIGLGLIGGSIAYTLKTARYASHISAFDIDPTALELAVELNIIDSAAPSVAAAVANADIVVLAAPLNANTTIFSALKNSLKEDAIVTDIGSVKMPVIALAQQFLSAEQLTHFVPGHPMAGSEKTGLAAANATLFQQRPTILTPLETTNLGAVQTITELWEKMGARVEMLAAEQHDFIVAGISHLPQLLSYIFIDSLSHTGNIAKYQHFIGNGFRDFTRIAASDPELWRDICMANHAALSSHLAIFKQRLTAIEDALKNNNGALLEETFTQARNAKLLLKNNNF